MTSFTRASRASAGRARGLRARLSSFSAVRGPVGLLYAPNVRGTAWATGFLSWRRGNVTLTQSETLRLRDFFTYYLYRPTIDRDRYEIIPRGRHRARGCVGLPFHFPTCFPSFHAPRPRRGGLGRTRGARVSGRDVAYVSTHVFPAALRCDMDYAMVLRRRIPPRGEIRIRLSRDTRPRMALRSYVVLMEPGRSHPPADFSPIGR